MTDHNLTPNHALDQKDKVNRTPCLKKIALKKEFCAQPLSLVWPMYVQKSRTHE